MQIEIQKIFAVKFWIKDFNVMSHQIKSISIVSKLNEKVQIHFHLSVLKLHSISAENKMLHESFLHF